MDREEKRPSLTEDKHVSIGLQEPRETNRGEVFWQLPNDYDHDGRHEPMQRQAATRRDIVYGWPVVPLADASSIESGGGCHAVTVCTLTRPDSDVLRGPEARPWKHISLADGLFDYAVV